MVAKKPNDFSYGRAVAILSVYLSFMFFSVIFIFLAYTYKKNVSDETLLVTCLGVMGINYIGGALYFVKDNYYKEVIVKFEKNNTEHYIKTGWLLLLFGFFSIILSLYFVSRIVVM